MGCDMKTFASKEKQSTPVTCRAQASKFGFRGSVVKDQQAEIRRIFRSTGAQPKLRVGQPNDKYEKEADRVADQVMRMSDTDITQRVDAELVSSKQIQPACTDCEEKLIQPTRQTAQPSELPPSFESKLNSLKGGGKPLDSATSNFFEPRFGQSFSDVRVHTNNTAAETAKSINARAFTIGNHVVMGSGEYQPSSPSGRRLLGHELTHVVQQGERVQRTTAPLTDTTTFQSPGSSGWRGATWGCYRSSCAKKHKGWDLNATVGTQCKAAVAGTTAHASENGGYGDYVVLTSTADSTKKYIYAHMGTREAAGTVAEGDNIGKVGTSGNASSTRPHLHFTVKVNGAKVDPGDNSFTKPTKVVEAAGSAATAFNAADPDPCTPCAM